MSPASSCIPSAWNVLMYLLNVRSLMMLKRGHTSRRRGVCPEQRDMPYSYPLVLQGVMKLFLTWKTLFYMNYRERHNASLGRNRQFIFLQVS